MHYRKKKKYPKLIFAIAVMAVLLLFFHREEEKIGMDLPVTEEVVVLETEEQKEQATEEMENQKEEELADAFALEAESTRILKLSAGELVSVGMVHPSLVDTVFFASEIDEAVFLRINGNSYTENDVIQISELSYLKMMYYGFDGNTYVGEMIVNQKIAEEVLRIFQTLYENQYQIEKMVLIDEYDADDETSMNENNTSAFNYRKVSGSNRLSNHSYGMAIDLNPKYNPYVKTALDGSTICQPSMGVEYADRTKTFAHKIDEDDLAYQLFTQEGFHWGGDWNSVKDYQHFEKTE